MDGTLIDSTPGLKMAWEQFCIDYDLGDPDKIIHDTHGRRLSDTLKDICNINDEEKLLTEINRFEEQVIMGGPIALPGVKRLIKDLQAEHPSRWTIVTSATAFYAPRALERCGIPLPVNGIITSNDVEKGKPHPDPYLTGARKCGADPRQCLVIEDAIAGLVSGRNAGSKTIAVCTSTPRATIEVSDAEPDFIIDDLTRLSVHRVEGSRGIKVTIEG
ncbi:HAD-like protein [Marasmius fiardii PR-910]|nr:HAD-like protein [Marasmius fiardii PR-910]